MRILDIRICFLLVLEVLRDIIKLALAVRMKTFDGIDVGVLWHKMMLLQWFLKKQTGAGK